MAANGPERIALFNRRTAERGQFDQRWTRMAPYIAPSRVGINGAMNVGDSQVRGVYDSTTLMAGELMSQFIAGQVMNPGQRWLNYVPYAPMDTRQDNDAIMEWLEDCRDRSLRRLATSFFYATGTECLLDFVGFGTGCLLGEESPQPVNTTIRGFRGFYFTAEKTGRFVIAEGPDGLINELDRERWMSAGKINERWGEKSMTPGQFPENIQKAIQENDTEKPFRLIHSIYPRPKADQGYGGKGMPWASCWTEFDSKKTIYESGYRVFPAAIPRYQQTPGEVFGRGRGDIAFPDTWTLNSAKRMGLQDWALKIQPPIMHHTDSIFGTIKLTPGAPLPVNTHGRPIRDVVHPYETGSRPEVSQIKEEELRKSIRQIFFVDHILALLEVNKSEMTAFEFAKKLNLLYQLLGPVYGRTEWELLYRISSICFATQMAGGDFAPPPPQFEEYLNRSKGQLAIEFDNPIARAQRSADAEALGMVFGDLAPLSNLAPDAFDRFDFDEVVLGVSRNRGIPAKWMRNERQLETYRNAKDAELQAQKQQEQIALAAESAGKVAPFIKAAKETVPGAA